MRGLLVPILCAFLAGCAKAPTTMHDTLAVRETIERFHDAVNRRSPGEIAELFVESGVWEVAPPYEHRFQGRRAIEIGIGGTIGATEALVQSCGPIVVELVDATRARARTTLHERGRLRSGAGLSVAGTYHDELAREGDGTWRFVHRRFVAHHADDTVRVADEHAVADVVVRFVAAIGAREFGRAAELFAENAVWSSSAGDLSFHHEGREAVRAFLEKSSEKVEVQYYSAGVPAVTLQGGGRAQSRVTLTEVLHLKATGERRLLLGTYVDELANIDGAWLFTRRHVVINHAETLQGTQAPR